MSEPQQYFIEAILPCRHRMYAAALAITWSEETAADIVQSILLACWERISEGNTMKSPMSYCLSAVRNRSIDEARRLSRLIPIEDAPETPVAEKLNDESGIEDALRRLPSHERQAIRMSALAGCSSKEIAEALHTSQANSRQILSRARRRLRQLLANSKF